MVTIGAIIKGFTVTHLFSEVDENNQTLGGVDALLSKLVDEFYLS